MRGRSKPISSFKRSWGNLRYLNPKFTIDNRTMKKKEIIWEQLERAKEHTGREIRKRLISQFGDSGSLGTE